MVVVPEPSDNVFEEWSIESFEDAYMKAIFNNPEYKKMLEKIDQEFINMAIYGTSRINIEDLL